MKIVRETGYCPVIENENSIEIKYVDRIDGDYEKKRFECNIHKRGGLCNNPSNCPVYRNASKTIS